MTREGLCATRKDPGDTTKILSAATKARHNQINLLIKKESLCKNGDRDYSDAVYKSRTAMECQEPPEAREGCGTVSRRNLQNCKRISFCYFKPPSWWLFVMVALENEYRFLPRG